MILQGVLERQVKTRQTASWHPLVQLGSEGRDRFVVGLVALLDDGRAQLALGPENRGRIIQRVLTGSELPVELTLVHVVDNQRVPVTDRPATP